MWPAISTDGRFVAFFSGATNLVVGDTNGARNIFMHDQQTGQTTCVSVNGSGNPGNGHSGNPSISADGRYVGIVSYSSNLDPGDTNGRPDVSFRQMPTIDYVGIYRDGVWYLDMDGLWTPQTIWPHILVS